MVEKPAEAGVGSPDLQKCRHSALTSKMFPLRGFVSASDGWDPQSLSTALRCDFESQLQPWAQGKKPAGPSPSPGHRTVHAALPGGSGVFISSNNLRSFSELLAGRCLPGAQYRDAIFTRAGCY